MENIENTLDQKELLNGGLTIKPIIKYDEQGRMKYYKGRFGSMKLTYHENGDYECDGVTTTRSYHKYITTIDGVTFCKEDITFTHDNSKAFSYYVERDVNLENKDMITFISIRTDNPNLTPDDVFKIGEIVELNIDDKKYIQTIQIDGIEYNNSIVVVEEVVKSIFDIDSLPDKVLFLNIINNKRLWFGIKTNSY